MAAKISPTSPWVETFDDKDNKWLQARIEHFERQELQTAGSVVRRKELFMLRKLLAVRRDQEATATAAAGASAPTSTSATNIPDSLTANASRVVPLTRSETR